jgi:hypothetical protein
MKQPINLDNDDHLHMIRHFAHQAGSTPVHLDNESIRGLRNLHNLVHNEDVEHDFSKLKTLFAQPNIAIHLKSQIEKKKANGGVINDYINTLKHNGSGENSELSLVPNELVKFLDDSYSLGTTNPHTGHKEYYLGKMFDGLNNIFKPIKDSMTTTPQTPIPSQTSTSMHEEQPREGHGWGDMIGMPTLSGIKNAASNLGTGAYNAASTLGNVASNLGTGTYNAASTLGNAAYGLGKGTYNAASNLGNAAYNTGKYAYDIGKGTYNAASNLGNTMYGLGKYAYGAGNTPSGIGNTTSPPGLIQNVMRGIAGPIGGAVGGLGGQYAGQKAGQSLAAGIPLIGHLAAPIVGNIAGNMAYNAGANRGKNKGIELADNLYNYLGGGAGGNASGINSNQPSTTTSSRFPTLSGIGNTAYNTASNLGTGAYNAASTLGNTIYGLGKKAGNTAYNAASTLGNTAYGLGKKVYDTASDAGKYAYSKLPTMPRFNTGGSVGENPFENLASNTDNFNTNNPFINQ